MRAVLDWGWMVRKQGDTNRFVPLFDLLEDGAQYALVDILHALLLKFCLTIVTSFVGSLHVQEDKILLLELLKGSSGLAFIVGVPQAGSARNFDLVKAAIDANAENQVNGRDDCARVDL